MKFVWGSILASVFVFGSVTSQGDHIPREVDIVFTIDVTGSMQPYIDSVREQVSRFVTSLAKRKLDAHLCLVTFKDAVEDKCNRFVENAPGSKFNKNLADFQDSLGRLKSQGGADMPENQLAALEAAAAAPWHPGVQSVAILITDAAFHFGPDKYDIGDGIDVPSYNHTASVLLFNGVKTFILGPDTRGYHGAFRARDGKVYPDLPTASGGGWFNLPKIKDPSDIGGFLEAIADQLVKDIL